MAIKETPWIDSLIVKELDGETVRVRFDIPVDFFSDEADAKALLADLADRLRKAMNASTDAADGPKCSFCGKQGGPMIHHQPMRADIYQCLECEAIARKGTYTGND